MVEEDKFMGSLRENNHDILIIEFMERQSSIQMCTLASLSLIWIEAGEKC